MRLFRGMVASVLLVLWPGLTCHALLQQWGVIHRVAERDHDHHHHHRHHHHADAESGGHHPDDGRERERNTINHDFAHGDYCRGSSGIQFLESPNSDSYPLVVPATCVALASAPQPPAPPSGLPPPGTAPPELIPTWHFALRAALPARAPSTV